MMHDAPLSQITLCINMHNFIYLTERKITVCNQFQKNAIVLLFVNGKYVYYNTLIIISLTFTSTPNFSCVNGRSEVVYCYFFDEVRLLGLYWLT